MVVRITSGGKSIKASSIRPSKGTGHSTRPATSAIKASSGTTSSPSAVASAVMPSRIMRARSSASSTTWRSASSALYSAKSCTLKAPGDMIRWPSVKSPLTSPCPSSAPCARVKGTTAPSSTHKIRFKGRTHTMVDVPPQRMDFGQGKARISAGRASATKARASSVRPGLDSTQNCPSCCKVLRVAPCFLRKPSIA